MTDWDRLMEYIRDYFPEPTYSTKDIRDWAMENVPSWKYIGRKVRKGILDDWERFIEPQVEDIIRGKTPSFWGRIRSFLGRLMGGRE